MFIYLFATFHFYYILRLNFHMSRSASLQQVARPILLGHKKLLTAILSKNTTPPYNMSIQHYPHLFIYQSCPFCFWKIATG